MGKLFGTDGVRGVANRELTPEMALLLGRVGAFVLAGEVKHRPKVLVGKDTRRSGDMLAAALTAGLCAVGAEVYDAGTLPTPGVAYLTRKYKLDAGVMVSASHNPMADNGIKFFSGDGYKLSDELEDEIERIYFTDAESLPRPDGTGVGLVVPCPAAAEDYADFLCGAAPGLSLAGYAVALDCAHGAASRIAEGVFTRLGAAVHTLYNRPDGANINDGCGSTHPEALCAYVRDNKMDIGLAFDGDADRLQCVDENGELVNGDEIMALCALEMHRQGRLSNNTLVATVMSNMGLSLMCKANGIRLIQTDVGDRYVVEKMLAGDYTLGGEQSGHIIFKEHSTTGDGILTGAQVLAIMQKTGRPLSALKTCMDMLPQALVNARVDNAKKPHLPGNRLLARAVAEVENKLKGEGRVLVRASGTEPVVRVMIEGRDPALITEWADHIARQIEAELS